MIQKMNKTSVQNSVVEKAIDSNFRKYKRTYQLLDQYDKSPQTTPSYKVELKALQKTLQYLPE